MKEQNKQRLHTTLLVKHLKRKKNQGEKQMKILEEHGKQLVKYSDEIKSLTH